MGKIRVIAILGFAGFLVAGAAVHNVDTAVTEDEAAPPASDDPKVIDGELNAQQKTETKQDTNV